MFSDCVKRLNLPFVLPQIYTAEEKQALALLDVAAQEKEAMQHPLIVNFSHVSMIPHRSIQRRRSRRWRWSTLRPRRRRRPRCCPTCASWWSAPSRTPTRPRRRRPPQPQSPERAAHEWGRLPPGHDRKQPPPLLPPLLPPPREVSSEWPLRPLNTRPGMESAAADAAADAPPATGR